MAGELGGYKTIRRLENTYLPSVECKFMYTAEKMSDAVFRVQNCWGGPDGPQLAVCQGKHL